MSDSVYEIPLSPSPKRFAIQLGGVSYQFVLTYRDADMGGWVLDINDGLGNPIACGLPLVTGHDMLEQFSYLGFQNGVLFVMTDGNPDAVPTFDNLGLTGGSHLYWYVI